MEITQMTRSEINDFAAEKAIEIMEATEGAMGVDYVIDVAMADFPEANPEVIFEKLQNYFGGGR